MSFASEAQRRWYFANVAVGGGGSGPVGSSSRVGPAMVQAHADTNGIPPKSGGGDVGAGFVRMTADEISAANRMRNDDRVGVGWRVLPEMSAAESAAWRAGTWGVGAAAVPVRREMPSMTDEESAIWRAGTWGSK